MIILGIDPGSQRIGYGLIKKEKGVKFLTAGLLDIRQRSFNRLLELKNGLVEIIQKFRPEILAIEKLFFVKNQKTGLSVAEARGAIILTALENGLKINEYAPTEVKAGITGYGRADKKGVAKIVKAILRKPDLRLGDDETDALALALLASQDVKIGY